MIMFAVLVFFLFLISVFVILLIELTRTLDRHKFAEETKPEDFGLSAQSHTFFSEDGYKLNAWYVKAKNPKGIVILAHRFEFVSGGKTTDLPYAKFLKSASYSSFLVDLRSYGSSDGSQTSLGINEWKDLKAAYLYLKKIQDKQHMIGFMGHSMGAATSLITAGKTKLGDFVIACTPYANIEGVIEEGVKRKKLPLFLLKPIIFILLRLKFGFSFINNQPMGQASNIKIPVFMIEGKNDIFIKKGEIKNLYNEIKGYKRYWQAEAGHMIFSDQPKKFEQKVINFLNTLWSNYDKFEKI